MRIAQAVIISLKPFMADDLVAVQPPAKRSNSVGGTLMSASCGQSQKSAGRTHNFLGNSQVNGMIWREAVNISKSARCRPSARPPGHLQSVSWAWLDRTIGGNQSTSGQKLTKGFAVNIALGKGVSKQRECSVIWLSLLYHGMLDFVPKPACQVYKCS